MYSCASVHSLHTKQLSLTLPHRCYETWSFALTKRTMPTQCTAVPSLGIRLGVLSWLAADLNGHLPVCIGFCFPQQPCLTWHHLRILFLQELPMCELKLEMSKMVHANVHSLTKASLFMAFRGRPRHLLIPVNQVCYAGTTYTCCTNVAVNILNIPCKQKIHGQFLVTTCVIVTELGKAFCTDSYTANAKHISLR